VPFRGSFTLAYVSDSRFSIRLLSVDIASFLACVGRVLVPINLTDLTLKKGEQVRQARKAPLLAGVDILRGSPPTYLPLVAHLPQAQ
jgi:hypothetical protein